MAMDTNAMADKIFFISTSPYLKCNLSVCFHLKDTIAYKAFKIKAFRLQRKGFYGFIFGKN